MSRGTPIDYIEGWGLCVSYDVEDIGGTLIDVGPAEGCVSDTCHHVSHDPAAPMRRWIPPAGWRLYRVHADELGTYYELERLGDVMRLVLHDEPHVWKYLVME